MKPIAASVATLAFVACLLLAACSKPEEEKGDGKSSPPEQRPTPRFADPWKVAADWPVPRGPVGDAQRFLLNAPAYQRTDDGEDLNTHQKTHGTIHVVCNEAVAMESVGPRGKDGIITDGKREFVFLRGGYEQEPGDSSATLMDQLKQASLQSLIDESEASTPFLGLEKINGVEAEIYALTLRQEGVLKGAQARVWVTKGDHRPLKVELKKSYHDGLNPSQLHSSIDTGTYTFAPGVKVTLPGP